MMKFKNPKKIGAEVSQSPGNYITYISFFFLLNFFAPRLIPTIRGSPKKREKRKEKPKINK